MATLEEICDKCIAVCQVPIEIPENSVHNHVKSHFHHGQILDTDKVDGIESNRKLTRLVLLCSSVRDVDHLCKDVKEEEIEIEGVHFLVKYQKAIACELPDRWENFKIPEQDNSQPSSSTSSAYGSQQPYVGPEPPPRNPEQPKLTRKDQQVPPNEWPPGPYGPVSGFYENLPMFPQGGADHMHGGGGQNMNQGGMPPQMQMYGHGQGQPPMQGNEHQLGHPPGFPEHDHRPGHSPPPGPQPNFPYGSGGHGQFPPGFPMFSKFQPDQQNVQGGQNMPFAPGMRMPMIFDPQTGQMLSFPGQGFPSMPHQQAQGGGIPRRPHPRQPSGPPPPYNSGEFRGQDHSTEVKSPTDRPDSGPARQSLAVADQKEIMQKLRAKAERDGTAEPTDYQAPVMEVSGKRKYPNTSSAFRGSAEDFVLFCIPCDSEGARVPAHGYCKNCQEHLCRTCFRHHKKPAPSRNHVLLDKDSMPTTPSVSDSKDDFESCHEHGDKKLKFYCRDHSTIVCSICVTLEHRVCKVEYIPKLSKNILGGSELQDLVTEMKVLGDICRSRIKKAKENVKSIAQNHEQVSKEIQRFRKEINTRLDEMELNVTSEADSMMNAQQQRIESLSTDLEDITKEIASSEECLDSLVQRNHLDKLFVEMKKAKKRFTELAAKERHVYQFSELHNIEFVKNQAILEMLQNQKQFGKLHYVDTADGMDSTLKDSSTSSEDKTLVLERVAEINVKSPSDKEESNILLYEKIRRNPP